MSCKLLNNYELVDERKILYDYDQVNKLEVAIDENLDHFVSKSMLYYLLSELNHDVICDYYITGVGKVDLYDITIRTIYNFQNTSSGNEDLMENDILAQSLVEVVCINIDELPDDIFQRYLKLREYLIIGACPSNHFSQTFSA